MNHPELKHAIMEVSLDLGTELGEEGLTMRAIARRLSVSATALYQHFDSKAAILRSLRFHALDRLNEALAPAFLLEDPIDRLRDHALRYLSWARTNPWLYSVLIGGSDPHLRGLTREEGETLSLSNAKIAQAFADGVRCGKLRGDVDVLLAPLMLWAALHGFVNLVANATGGSEHPAIHGQALGTAMEVFVEGVMRGFCSQPGD